MSKETWIWNGSNWDKLGDISAEDGKSLYDFYVDQGGTLSYVDWYNSMVGDTGPQGPTGPKGETGEAGIGIALGGKYNHVLVKASDIDYDTEWVPVYGYSVNFDTPQDYIAGANDVRGGYERIYLQNNVMYKTHTFFYLGEDDALQVFKGVIGQIIIVGGGGASGNTNGGGGGGGTVYYGDYAFGQGTHFCRVGAGGVNSGNRNGGNTRFDDIFCYGGGGGANSGVQGSAGGSSGGNGLGFSGVSSIPTGGTGEFFPQKFFFSQNNGVNGGGANLSSDISGQEYTYGAGGLGNQGSSAAGTLYGQGGRGGPSTGANGANGIVICRYRIG